MPLEERTIRDRIYSDFIKEFGPLTNSELFEKAAKHPHFREMNSDGLEKDVDRFVTHYKYLKIVERVDGKIKWLPQEIKGHGRSPSEAGTEPNIPSSPESRHETVQKLIRGMANGTITLRDKSPHKELNRKKGRIYDEFMADIELYNEQKNNLAISGILETHIFNTALKLRAYGFIEEKTEQPSSESIKS